MKVGINKIYLLFLLGIFISERLCAQKASLQLELTGPEVQDVSKSVFRIQVSNMGFEKYWVQDTTLLQKLVDCQGASLLIPFVQRKVAGTFRNYERFKNRTDILANTSNLDSCRTCIFLNRGAQVSFGIQILRSYNMEDGSYRLSVSITPPLFSCNGCKQLKPLQSQYLYFKIRRGAIFEPIWK